MNITFENLKELYDLARNYQKCLIKEGKLKEAKKNIPLLDKIFQFILIVTVENENMNKEDLYMKVPSISDEIENLNPEGKIYSTMESFAILFNKFNELWDKIEELEKRIERLEEK